MATHIWWITRGSSLWFSCSDCIVHEPLRFNKSNKWSIGFKYRLFAGHLSLCTMFATYITSVLLSAWHDASSCANIIPRLARIWRRTNRMTLFRYFIAVMVPWMVTNGVFVCMKVLEHVLLSLSSTYFFFYIIDNQRGTLFKYYSI